MAAHLQLIAPSTEIRSVKFRRKPNAELRTREYLTATAGSQRSADSTGGDSRSLISEIIYPFAKPRANPIHQPPLSDFVLAIIGAPATTGALKD